jgi:RNase adapter protein RapZ
MLKAVAMSEFLVLTGLSGAGRSQMAGFLEDLGWFVVDNLPVPLIEKIGDLAASGQGVDKMVIGAGSTMSSPALLAAIAGLKGEGHRVRIVFLEASTPELLRRYASTRRKHPLAQADGSNLAEAIDLERIALDDVKAAADLVLDTTDFNVHQLKDRVISLFSDDGEQGMQITVQSFGYKHGLPPDVDLVFDCRFLPNPFWDEELRPLSGLDDPVKTFVLSQPTTEDLLARLEHLLDLLVPAYVGEGRSYLTIAFGCTGGRHRSVVVSEHIAGVLRSSGHRPRIRHRDINR